MNRLRVGCICIVLIAGWPVIPAAAQDQHPDKLPPDQYNAYQAAITQPDPAAQALALEQLLRSYPAIAIKKTLLDQLIDAYQMARKPSEELNAANRLLQIAPNNPKGILISVYLDVANCKKAVDAETGDLTDSHSCGNAATLAVKGLNIIKPSDIDETAWKGFTAAGYPVFHSAIALDDVLAKKDYPAAIDEYTKGLMLYSLKQTESGPGLVDTLNLADALVKPSEKKDITKAIWLYARVWDFAPSAFKPQIEPKLDYWYKRYHGTPGDDDATRDQIEAIKTLASSSLFPPSSFAISKAPSPVSGSRRYDTPHLSTDAGACLPNCPVVNSPAEGRSSVASADGILEPRYVPSAFTSADGSGTRREWASAVTAKFPALSANLHPVYSIPEGAASLHENGTDVPGHFGLLNQQAASQVIQQVNKARVSMKGINSIPLHADNIFAQPNGNLKITTGSGQIVHLRADGTVASVRSDLGAGVLSSSAAKFQAVSFDRKGRITEFHNSAVDIYHGPHGIKTVVQHRPDGKILVSTGAHSGYLEQRFSEGGATYLRRSYLAGNSHSVRVYRAYTAHGQTFYRYVPARSYSAKFYAWTRSPWNPPALYTWLWNKPKWLNVSGHYYAAPFYNLSSSDWITDFLFTDIFDDADETDGEDSAPDPNAVAAQDSGDGDEVYADADTPVTPELKQAIANEVQEQLDEEAEQADSSGQGQQDDGFAHEWSSNWYFVTENPLEVAMEDGHTCLLDSGNVVQLKDDPTGSQADTAISAQQLSSSAMLTVVASRRFDCPANSRVTVPLDQLVDIENGLEARVDDGLQALFMQQSENGLPAAPASEKPVQHALYAAPDDNSDLQAMLTDQQKTAAQMEREARSNAVAELASVSQP